MKSNPNRIRDNNIATLEALGVSIRDLSNRYNLNVRRIWQIVRRNKRGLKYTKYYNYPVVKE
jgi:Mor family transcriptional regulator